MKSTAVFFDTEFTNFENPELVSIGAVSVDGKHEFYAEVSPLPDGCSDFVIQHIVPQLTGPAYPKEEVARRFLEWLAGLGNAIELCSDSGFDRNIINALCGYPLPIPNGATSTWYPLPGTVTDNPHHALQDARMLREAFHSYF
ncbi:MAG: hypothetical protein DELT_00479 [Desulfovibrio sp.]